MCFFFSTYMAFSQTGGLAHKKANCLKTYNISYYLSIYTYIQYFVPSWNFPQGPKGWPWQKSLHLSLSKYSFFVCSCPLPLVAPPLTHIILYPIVISLPSGIPFLLGTTVSLTCTFFYELSLFILSICSNHTSVFLFAHSTS